ncbi:hypothetical protein AVEN_249355-1 [Araneus ventricosus]|uniref:Uncharacterized protein n=1 Tax=Araneus ventricosus TaxID=182803 RepID=A0A4Y2JS31_ARAVE|nr:hypothetical protein AVEN_249355-1 [Araneus ventricosus]
MKDGVSSHGLPLRLKEVLRKHFSEEHVIRCYFRFAWPAQSPNLNRYHFWIREHLKELVSHDDARTLPEPKEDISLHAFNISKNLLFLTFEHSSFKLQNVHCGGQHVEQNLS